MWVIMKSHLCISFYLPFATKEINLCLYFCHIYFDYDSISTFYTLTSLCVYLYALVMFSVFSILQHIACSRLETILYFYYLSMLTHLI